MGCASSADIRRLEDQIRAVQVEEINRMLKEFGEQIRENEGRIPQAVGQACDTRLLAMERLVGLKPYENEPYAAVSNGRSGPAAGKGDRTVVPSSTQRTTAQPPAPHNYRTDEELPFVRPVDFPFDTPSDATSFRPEGDAKASALAPSVTHLNLSHLRRLRSVWERNFDLFAELRSLTIAGVTSLEVIRAGNFNREPTKIEEIDMSGGTFKNVSEIGENFVNYLDRLQSLKLGDGSCPLVDLPKSFVSNCESLETVTLPHFSNLRHIGDSCLSVLPSLSTVDLSVFASVVTIGNYFLSFCEDLVEVDFTALSQVQEIGDGFLATKNAHFSCGSSLRTVKGMNSLGANLKMIGGYFLAGHGNLQLADLTSFTAVDQVGTKMLDGVRVDRIAMPRVATSALKTRYDKLARQQQLASSVSHFT